MIGCTLEESYDGFMLLLSDAIARRYRRGQIEPPSGDRREKRP